MSATRGDDNTISAVLRSEREAKVDGDGRDGGGGGGARGDTR